MGKSEKQLHQAIWDNDYENIIYYLKKGEDSNEEDENGIRPLDVAIITNNVRAVKLLVENDLVEVKIDMTVWYYVILCDSIENYKIIPYLIEKNCTTVMNIKNSQGETPIHLAIIHRSERLVNLFVKLGADVNIATKNGFTPLHLAAIENDINIIKILLNGGANVNAKTVDGRSPLHLAVKHRHKDSLSLLIKEKADINGKTPLHIAIENDDENMVNALLKMGANLFCTDNRGRNLLHTSAEYGYKGLVKFFLQNGIGINSVTNDNLSSLLIAIENRKVDVAEFLLQQGVKLNIRDNLGQNELHLAVKYSYESIVQFLLEQEIDVNDTTLDGSTALHYAANLDYSLNVVKLLLKHGAKVDAENNNCETALRLTARHSSDYKLEILKVLLKHGANPNHITKDNTRPLEWCFKIVPNLRGVKVLLEYGANIDKINENGDGCLHLLLRGNRGCFCKKQRYINTLLDYGANINSVNKDNETPLLLFMNNFEEQISKYEYSNMMKFIIDKGAILSKNKFGESLLHLAVKRNIENLVEYLLEKDAKFEDITDVDKSTVVHYAAQYSSKEVTELLLARDLPIDFKNNEGKTPLHLAAA